MIRFISIVASSLQGFSEIEPTDHPLGPGRIFTIWAKGQTQVGEEFLGKFMVIGIPRNLGTCFFFAFFADSNPR